MTQVCRTTCLLLAMFASVASSALGAEYSVRVDDSNPLVAEATLNLPPNDGQPRALICRGEEWGLQIQVSKVRGDRSPLAKSNDGQWLVPADCRTVNWTIHFRDSIAGPVHASSQQNVFFRNERWWLISEPTALLRLKGTKGESTLSLEPERMFQLGAMPSGNNGWRIPASGQASEFFVVGHARSKEVTVDGFRVLYVSDDSQRVAKLGMQDRHVAAFRYLLTLFPQSVNVPRTERRLMIVWIGVDAANRQTGGAGGSRSIIANYVYGEPAGSDDYAASNLMVVAHEQFHQLTALCIQPDASLPTWVNKSLAQYYGLKALANSGLGSTAVARAQDRFIDPDRTVEKGLAELSRQFQQGDRSVYPLFYSQGATLWAEIDRALSAETGGEKSLDEFLPALFRGSSDETRAFPTTLLAPLREVIGDRRRIVPSSHTRRPGSGSELRHGVCLRTCNHNHHRRERGRSPYLR